MRGEIATSEAYAVEALTVGSSATSSTRCRWSAELDLFVHDGVDKFRRDGNWAIAHGVVIDTWELLGEHNPHLAIAYDVLLPYAHRFISVGWAADAYGTVERLLGVLAGLLEHWNDAEVHFRAGFEHDRRTVGVRQLARGHLQLARMYERRGATADDSKAAEVARAGLDLAAGVDLQVLRQRLSPYV